MELITFVALTFIAAIDIVALTIISARVEFKIAVVIWLFRSLAELVEIGSSYSWANVAFIVESE